MKLIEIPHKACNINCPWNGLEDQYHWITGVRPPKHLFFSLSGIVYSIYTDNSDIHPSDFHNSFNPQMYNYLKDIIGFSYDCLSPSTFNEAFDTIKSFVDKDIPVLIGALDLYNLPYFGWAYHKLKIPIHYIMVVGYDEKEKFYFINENDSASLRKVPFSDIEDSWNENKPFKLFTFKLDNLNTIEHIAKEGFKKKAHDMIVETHTDYTGIDGYRRFANDLFDWETNLPKDIFKRKLLHFLEYTCFPPQLPTVLLDYDPIYEFPFRGARDIIEETLQLLHDEFQTKAYLDASKLFKESGDLFEEVNTLLTNSILKNEQMPSIVKKKINCIADLEHKAYSILYKIDS